jgi:hypothetical protein
MVSLIIVLTHFRITMKTNCQALTRCLNVSYVVRHERESSHLFILLLSILIIFWYSYVESIYETSLQDPVYDCLLSVCHSWEMAWNDWTQRIVR